jgi:hypothetical protein
VQVKSLFDIPKHPKVIGILLGIDMQCFDIGAIDDGDYYVKFQLRNKRDNFKWALAIVYGSAQQNEKEHFLA